MKNAGLSGEDDRRSLTETLNEMESVLSREKTTAPNLVQPSNLLRIVGGSRRDYIRVSVSR
jgi:hypothetical protein